MAKNYRVLNLTKKQIKDLTKKKAVDFATEKEKNGYKFFNIKSGYKIKDYAKIKIFDNPKELRNFAIEYIIDEFEENDIIQVYVLYMQ